MPNQRGPSRTDQDESATSLTLEKDGGLNLTSSSNAKSKLGDFVASLKKAYLYGNQQRSTTTYN
jgi:hypothetical protein